MKSTKKPAKKSTGAMAARHVGSSGQARLPALKAALEEAKLHFKVLEMRIEELEEENRKLRSTRWGTEEFLREELRKVHKEKAELAEKLDLANKQLAWFRKQKFDGTTEKSPDAAGEMSANAAAAAAPDAEPVEEKEEKPAGKRSKGQQPDSKGHGRSDRSELDTDVEYLDIPGGCSCGKCGKPYRLMARTEASPLTEIDVTIIRTIFQRCMYVSQCDCEGKKIQVAEPPKKLYPRTEIGNSLWVWLVVHKFLLGVPQSRILKQLDLWGLSLAAGTVTGGYKLINDLLAPLMEALINHCRGADFWNADETTWRIFGEGKLRWWFWLIASADAVVYLLDPSRSKRVPSEFFAGSAGILMTDRLASYKALHASIRKAWCWAHVRRDIFNIFLGIPQLKPWARGWLLEIATLYVLTHKRFVLWNKGITSGQQWDRITVELDLHVQKMREHWEKDLARSTLHKEQKKALNSMKRHWKGLSVFLEDARIPLDNNRAERLLRNAVILRKNSFGSGAPWAGHLAAKLFSIFQTWLINGLNPESLLRDYFDSCSNGKPPPDLTRFLPWTMSQERKNKFALPDSYKRPG